MFLETPPSFSQGQTPIDFNSLLQLGNDDEPLTDFGEGGLPGLVPANPPVPITLDPLSCMITHVFVACAVWLRERIDGCCEDEAKNATTASSHSNFRHFISLHSLDMSAPDGIESLELAADDGDIDAMVSLARSYYQGLGVRQDLDQAARYCKMAADHGDTKAQYEYALCLAHGKGLPRISKTRRGTTR